MTQDQIDKVLKEIQESIPKALMDRVIIRTPATPTMILVVDKALEDPNISAEKKAQLQTLKDNGYFNKERIKEDPVVAKQIDNFYGRAINKAVREGRLPNKSQLRKLQLQWKQEKNSSKA